MAGPSETRDLAGSLSPALLILAVACLGGAGAALAGAAPTGLGWWDALLTALFVSGVVLAAAKAARWAVILLATAACGAIGIGLTSLFAWLGLGVALASVTVTRRSGLLGAVSAALSMQALLRLPEFGFFGLPSLFVALASAAVLVSGYVNTDKLSQYRLRIAAAVAIAIVFVVSLVGGLALLSARADVDRGVDAARRGLVAVRAGNPAEVVQELNIASEALSNAEGSANGPLSQGLRFVPVLAQHHQAVRIATGQGAIVARQAAAAANEVDLDELTLQAGRLDLQAVQAVAPRLRETADALERSSEEIEVARSGWLIAPLRSQLDTFGEELDQVVPQALLAADAVEIVPQLLGVDGPRRYFVIFGTPAESRELGGLLGSWAVLEVEQGSFRLGEAGRINELYQVAQGNDLTLDVVNEWFLQMARPTEFPQNLTSSPDFRTVAAAAQVVFEGAFDGPVDGYVYLDPHAVIDLLELTGPVQNPFDESLLSVDNADAFFFRDQYDGPITDRNRLFDSLADVATSVLDELSTASLPGPEELGRILGPAARAGSLQVVTFDDAHNQFLTDVKLLRQFDRGDHSDFFALVQTNGTPSKLDLYLERSVTYEATVDSDGRLAGTLAVELRSSVPDDAPEVTLGVDSFDAVNRVLLSLYSPHPVTEARINGQPVEIRRIEEFSMLRYLVDVPVQPTGGPERVEFDIAGSVDPDDSYGLLVWHQPLVNSDELDISVETTEGRVEWQGTLVENLSLDVEESSP